MKYRLSTKRVYIPKDEYDGNRYIGTRMYHCERPVIQMRILGFIWITIIRFFGEDKSESNKEAIKCFNFINKYGTKK